MPIIPSVFQPIKQNDVQQRPFKAYKRYKLKGSEFSSTPLTGSGGDVNNAYVVHTGIFAKHTPHIDPNNGQGVHTRTYPINTFDRTNMHVVWNTIDFRYYRNYTPATVFDFKDIEAQSRFLWYSASILTIPYHDVGERFKEGTFQVTSSFGSASVNLNDDGNGNLIDPKINTATFASSSRNFFYMSFNDLYRNFNHGHEVSEYTGSINYLLNHSKKKAIIHAGVNVVTGIQMTGSRYDGDLNQTNHKDSSGLGVGFTMHPKGSAPFIRIPNNDKFDRFGRCDDWTISFWHRPMMNQNDTREHYIMTKWGLGKEIYQDRNDKKRKVRDVTITPRTITTRAMHTAADFETEKIRTPLNIVYSRKDNDDAKPFCYFFSACDGTKAVEISGSTNLIEENATNADQIRWQHVVIRNESEVCKMFINGVQSTISASLPPMTINTADILIGAPNRQASSTDSQYFMPYGTDVESDGKTQEIAEIRFYDYAVSDIGIQSLANNNYISASCYQTNVAGNVFHKNGQAVVSSPLPKYHTGSGVFGNDWTVTYRGTHTIYENEVLVRVPKDTFNVTMNPTANYRPATVGEICAPNHQNIPTGELRKPLFVSGTLKPYITTIGLYDDKAQMLAVAKLSTPVQKLDDVDMNFFVRWDY